MRTNCEESGIGKFACQHMYITLHLEPTPYIGALRISSYDH